MRSGELDLSRYDTDKVENHYIERYDPIFTPLANKEIKLLEIGVYKGGSLLMWRDYFPQGTIVGIDLKLPQDFVSTERLYVYEGSQTDVRFLSDVAGKTAPEGYDIIIDDASHIGELTKITFWHLFNNHLKGGGLYAIEDWGTGYWDDWPDGKSINSEKTFLSTVRSLLSFRNRSQGKVPFPCHSYGMVGFIKELIDEQGATDLSRGSLAGKHNRISKFESVLVAPGIVFVKKAG